MLGFYSLVWVRQEVSCRIALQFDNPSELDELPDYLSMFALTSCHFARPSWRFYCRGVVGNVGRGVAELFVLHRFFLWMLEFLISTLFPAQVLAVFSILLSHRTWAFNCSRFLAGIEWKM